jgi:hypothetical protein
VKKITCLLLFLAGVQLCTLTAQNVSITANGTAPDASAMLDIQSSTMGLSIPNIALTGTNSSSPIAATPKTGLIVYNTATAGSSPNNVIPGFYYWNGSKWVSFVTGSNAGWGTNGSTGTIAGTNFIGTTDAVDFVTKTNNAEAMRVSAAGNIGIGNAVPVSKLDVAAGTTTINSVVNATGSINDFLQYNIQNTSTGTHAQSGYSSTADNGSNTTGFAWMGINNSNFNDPTTYNIGGANDVSFLGSGQDMYVANANNTKSIIFSTGISASPFFSERMRITSGGLVGIGTSSPVATLDVGAGATTNNTVVNASGTINDFLQFNVQNLSNGTNAQSGYSATADNGTSTTGFVWMGINNSAFNYPTAYNIGGANDVSLLGSGQDMYVANANNTKSIIFSTGKAGSPYFNERMRITNAGNVGIGTASPTYPLDVQAVYSTSVSSFGYLNSSGVSGYVSGSSGAMNFSARFSGRVVSPEFVAQSDIRIKDIKGRSNSADDLKLLNTIQITDYEMKDKVLWGNTRFKKIIAQEVEAVYPQVVNKTTGFVPDIYATATISQSDSCFKLRLPADISINKDTKRIRIITNNGNRDMDFVSSPDARTLILKGELPEVKEGENVFVYGQEVNDFRVVDYEGLSTLNISATQELYKLLVKQQEEINALKKENGTLKTDLSAQMESLKLQMNAILYPVAKQ